MTRATLLALALLAAAPAVADPAVDTLETITQAYCAENHKSTDECLMEFPARMAGNQGYQEAALLACPGLRVTDPALREFRTKKYGSHPEFKKSYAYVIEGIGRPDFDEEKTCRIASKPEVYPTAYQGEWLTLRWTAADRLPLMTTVMMGRAGGRFRAGYADGRLAGEQDQAAYRAYRAYGTREGDNYERGWEAGRIDAMRARRK